MSGKRFAGLLFTAALAGSLVGCGSNQGGNAPAGNNTAATGKTGGEVTIGYVNWAEDVAVSNLWKAILEDKGYKVQLKQLDAGPLFIGLSQGSLDVFFDTWLPVTHKSYMDQYGDKLTNLGQWYQGQAKIGLVVPKDSGVNSIADLNAHASDFGNQIVGIDAGAGEMKTAKKAVQDYGLKLNLVSGSEASMLSALQKAENEKKPIVVTLWSPHWAFAKWTDLKYLDDPKGDFGAAEHIQTEANKDWASNNPQLSKWIQNFKLSDTQLGQLEMDINNASDPLIGAKKWMNDNKDLVNGWLS